MIAMIAAVAPCYAVLRMSLEPNKLHDADGAHLVPGEREAAKNQGKWVVSALKGRGRARRGVNARFAARGEVAMIQFYFVRGTALAGG